MKTKVQYLVYIAASLTFGILLGFCVYLFIYFIFFLAAFTIVFLIIFTVDIIKETSEWKKFKKPILFTVLALLSSYLTTRVMQYDILNTRNRVVENIYAYRAAHNKFPIDISNFGNAIKIYHYSVDSSLNSFEVTFRGMYGIPNSFNSKDSVWTVP